MCRYSAVEACQCNASPQTRAQLLSCPACRATYTHTHMDHEAIDNAYCQWRSIREVYFSDKFNGESLLSNSGKNYLDSSRSLFRDGFFPEGLDQQQAKFAWTEEDGNIAALVSEPGFGTTGQTTFGKDLDAAFKSELKEADTSSSVSQTTSRSGLTFIRKPYSESQLVTSTSTGNGTERKNGQGARKVDKTDPRSRFHFVKYVKRHGRTVKLWECGICSREFQHQYTLMRHLPTHTDERNFHCEACGKSFRQLSTLSQHRAIHSAERPYTCEVCNKTFNRVSTLISHRKTHSDEKPYKCHICPKGFHQKGNLRNHLFTHTNERPYRCNICLKGFNQQSNLVCHKNKAHSEDSCGGVSSRRNSVRLPQTTAPANQPDSTRTSSDHCEVSSTVGPYLPSIEGPSSSSWGSKWPTSKSDNNSKDLWGLVGSWEVGSGVIVDPIKTYHMGVALATKQTPFALLKPDNGTPVLVKVIDTKLPGGKQMLVPATAEDLKVGGKIVLKSDEHNYIIPDAIKDPNGSAVQIRVPVVATVVPKVQGGRLHLAVEEPHHAYHTALSADIGEVKVEPCSSNHEHLPLGCKDPMPRLHPIKPHDAVNVFDDSALRPAGSRLSASCSLPPPAPSPPLDLIPMDLFEPMECIPLGPQITAVGNIDQPPPSDDSDIFIGEFEESIPLSDSD